AHPRSRPSHRMRCAVAAMSDGELPRDPQAQAEALLLGREERLKRAVGDLGRHSGTVITNGDPYLLLVGVRGDGDGASRPCGGNGFEGVEREGEDDLLKRLLLAGDLVRPG